MRKRENGKGNEGKNKQIGRRRDKDEYRNLKKIRIRIKELEEMKRRRLDKSRQKDG